MPTPFSTHSLRPELLAALEQLAYVEMTPIQEHALGPILAGVDVIGQAKTGSGKTAAFGLGVLNRLEVDRLVVQGLVLCPTRELADQVAGELRRLAQRSSNIRVITLCGGRPSREQRLALQQGAHVVVGTPGRVGEHVRKGTLNLDSLMVLVLDEADRMLDMGFIDEVQTLISACPADRQTLMFSATFPDKIVALSAEVQDQPISVAVASQVEGDKLRQLAFECEAGQRRELLVRLLAEYRPESALIFCETRTDCDKLASFLTGRGAAALALHGGLEQRERDDVLVQFTNGSARLLVATNVAARGLDIPSLPAVIVAELSPDPESHLHRIGRTGRAGEVGLALSIVAGPVERARLEQIEAFLEQPIERGPEPSKGSAVTLLAAPYRTVMIFSGRKDKLRKGDVLGALIKDAGIGSESIGRIDVAERTCAVAVSRPFAAQALKYLQSGRVKNKRVRAVFLGK